MYVDETVSGQGPSTGAAAPFPSYEAGLTTLLARDDRFIVMTAENRAAIRGLPPVAGPRFIDVGICEQTLIGAAAGLALRGRVPIVHALATFLTMRAFEFIRTDVGIAGLPVKLVGGFPGFLSEANGPTHQAIEDVALMRGIPGMKVWCPADEHDLLLGLDAVMSDAAPWYLRYHAGPAVTTHHVPFEIGRAEVFGQGRDVTLLTYGLLFGECFRAAELLRKADLSVGLINLRTLKPIDREAILTAARRSALLVTVEDHFLTGGLFSIMAEALITAGLAVPVLPLALDERWFKPALLPDVLAYEGFTAESIADRVLRRLFQL
ncbi:transketolase family protein [Methylolobus aquaticus]